MTVQSSHLKPRTAARIPVFFAVTLGTLLLGFLAGILSGSMKGYGAFAKPALMPPDIVFPVVWSILYATMGISLYLVLARIPITDWQSSNKKLSVGLWIAQFAMNLCWPFAFFTLHLFGFSYVWLVAIVAVNLAYIIAVYRFCPAAAWLHMPYELWLMFAAYLNLMIAILN